jgi:16S rRNA (cytidine1402-2'-O)-methyltransferase
MGKLFLVPTPVGNLGDMTYRGVATLEAVDLVLAEDTRQTRKLMDHYNITNSLKAYHQDNEHQLTPKLVAEMQQGQKSMAIVSDAGTPGISDPGFLLVRAAVQASIPVEALPGPTAFLPALLQSGLPADRFVFEGFLPHKKGRQKRLAYLASLEQTVVLYVSPHRVLKTLGQCEEHFGADRPAALSRELTKVYENTTRGTLGTIKAEYSEFTKIKGELVLIIHGQN